MNKNSLKTSLRLSAVAMLSTFGWLGAHSAMAGTATANLDVGASVSDNCTISTSAIAFGAYDPVSGNASSPLDSTGTVTVQCTSGATTAVTLGQGANASGGSDAAPARRMNDGGSNNLAYFLYQDGAHSTVWGNTALTGKSHSGDGASHDITVHGSVPGGQNVPSGTYSDTVLATITF